MNAQKCQTGMNLKRKVLWSSLEWSYAKPGADRERGIGCAGQTVTGWKAVEGSPGGLRIGKKTATTCKISAIQYF